MKKGFAVILVVVLFTGPLVMASLADALEWQVAQIERLSPEERERVKKNYEEFKKLSPEEKMKLKQKYLQFQQATPEERVRLKENYRRFENMIPEDRRNLEKELGIDGKK